VGEKKPEWMDKRMDRAVIQYIEFKVSSFSRYRDMRGVPKFKTNASNRHRRE